MPCYGCQLEPIFRNSPTPLSNIISVACHGKTLRARFILGLLLQAFALFAAAQTSPDFGRLPELPPAPEAADTATVERPDFNVRIPRPNAPPAGDYDITSDNQEADKGVYRLHGHVVVELANATFRADEAEYDENTHIFKARGNVYYRNYDRNEVLYCDTAEYNTETQHGTFGHVRGFMKTKVQARPGLLLSSEPFYFEGSSAERFENRYVLHDGYITDCRVPSPWWTLRAKLFDITPDDRAVTRNGVFRIRRVPLFYFPYFYKGLKKEPRKSGFLAPEAGHSSQYGYFFGAGYYWAINRSMDTTYIVQDYTSRGFAHHVDFRGKPTQKSDFAMVMYGVNDRGIQQGGNLYQAGGLSLTGKGRISFADGWEARANVDYLSSLKFRQAFTQSFTEAIFSAVTSTGIVTKEIHNYTFNAFVSRTENFQDATAGNSIIIRKLPEFDFTGRDRQITSGALPLWFSFESSFGLYHRAEPRPEPGFYETSQFTPRGDFAPTLTTALRWKGLNIVPGLTLHERFYGQTLVNGRVENTATTRNAPEVNVDIVLPSIERVFGRKSFLGDKVKHVIEPRLGYRYVTGVDQFTRALRFDQLDLLSNTNEASIGITNRLYAKRGDSTVEVLSWELYQKAFFDPTFGGALIPGQRNQVLSAMDITGYTFLSQPRHYSPVSSILRMYPKPGIALQWQADYDPLRRGVVNSMFSTDFRVRRYFLSAGHNQVKPDPILSPPANQLRATVGYGETNRKGWNSAFSTVYDYRQGIMQYVIGQVSYNTDCCGFSVEFRRVAFGPRNDNQFKFAYTIANIGTFGNLKKQERIF